MLKFDDNEYNLSKLREVCKLLGITQKVVDEFENNDIDEICSYADKEGNIALGISNYNSAGTVAVIVETPCEPGEEVHQLCLTSINACEEGPFWYTPLEYILFLTKGELMNRGLNLDIFTDY